MQGVRTVCRARGQVIMTTSINFYLGNHRRVFAHQHHVIKVMVGKPKTRVGKLKNYPKLFTHAGLKPCQRNPHRSIVCTSFYPVHLLCMPSSLADTALAEYRAIIIILMYLVPISFVRKVFYLAWRGNGLADFDEIWHVGPSYALAVRLGKLAHTLSLLSNTRKTQQIGTKRQTPRLLQTLR